MYIIISKPINTVYVYAYLPSYSSKNYLCSVILNTFRNEFQKLLSLISHCSSGSSIFAISFLEEILLTAVLASMEITIKYNAFKYLEISKGEEL